MIQFDVTNRFSGNVQFTAEIECEENTSFRIKLGLSVRWAVRTGADLGDAYLGGAYLRDADLRGAYLGGAYLGGADLRDANLRDANLRDANLRGAYLRGADLGDAYLGGADLGGAYLGGANLGGLVISQGPVRNDGYQYILYTSCLGGCVIRAGCRVWVGENAIDQARSHCETVTHADQRPQALRIVDYLEAELAAIRSQDAFSTAMEPAQ